MEWTQTYEWICWMRPSRCMMWYRTAAVLGPNPVMVDRSLCRSYHQPNNILLSQPPLRTAQEQVDMWMLSCSGNMSVAREMLLTEIDAVRSASPQASMKLLDRRRTYLSRGYQLGDRMMTAS
jgi:hypothetical protein